MQRAQLIRHSIQREAGSRPRRHRRWLATVIVAAIAACQPADPGTSLLVTLSYEDSLGLDSVQVSLGDTPETSAIHHQLLLLVPDQLANTQVMVSVTGEHRGTLSAFGQVAVTPVRGKTVDASLTLDQCTPGCSNSLLTSCTAAPATCALGCRTDSIRCIVPQPSNGLDPTLADTVHTTIEVTGDAVFDTDTGAITGSITRPMGSGVIAGIRYIAAPMAGTGGASLGIFVFHDLTVDAAATITFTGKSAAVFLIGDSAQIAGTIDASAGHGGQSVPGPGGGAGGNDGVKIGGGCSPGIAGTNVATDDAGGGGGGGGEDGAPGGAGGSAPAASAGQACLPSMLVPLQGGSGGGRGSPGLAASSATGGGGGGAIQITALNSLVITGRVLAGGAGGEGGAISVSGNGGAGGGGGSGGAILLEAPTVTLADSTVLEANGGAGGGGSGLFSVNNDMPGGPGDNAHASFDIAQGGTGGLGTNNGGTGGANDSPPDVGDNAPASSDANGGGGGAGTGVIVIRLSSPAVMLAGTISPHATTGQLDPVP